MKTVFKKNKILYGQDFRFYSSIPTDIVFEVFDENCLYRLEAEGYGKKSNYGNGALLVHKKHWRKSAFKII